MISFQDQLEQLYNAGPNIAAERYILELTLKGIVHPKLIFNLTKHGVAVSSQIGKPRLLDTSIAPHTSSINTFMFFFYCILEYHMQQALDKIPFVKLQNSSMDLKLSPELTKW